MQHPRESIGMIYPREARVYHETAVAVTANIRRPAFNDQGGAEEKMITSRKAAVRCWCKDCEVNAPHRNGRYMAVFVSVLSTSG